MAAAAGHRDADHGGILTELEGDHLGSDDYCFIRIGEPVPLKPAADDDDPLFDSESPPSQPLVVSGGLIFVAHSTGFCVARTKNVIESAKEIKEKGHGSSIKEVSVVDVPLRRVSILALSADSSTLAASTGGDIHFFSVSSLLNKEQGASFSCSLNDSSCVKDMRWTKKLENCFVVLSNVGKLYHGARQGPLMHVMDNVDAVEWSMKGNFVAVARKNNLSILSSKFKQKFSIFLSFKSWIGDSDLDCTVKVDSIRWVRSDCIILGCFRLNADGSEENYLVQVITSKDGKITDVSSNPCALSFNDVFGGLMDDIVPFGTGPYMSLCYLDKCQLAITANRKSTDQQIVLFGWSQGEENREAAVIDILRDTLLPKIDLQGNGDENIVLGLSLDNFSDDEKVEVKLGSEYKELSPFCILLCLSLDGKLFMFHIASSSGASFPSEVASLLSDEEDDPTVVACPEDILSETSGLAVKGAKQLGPGSQLQDLNKEELNMGDTDIAVKNDRPVLVMENDNLQTLKTKGLPEFPVTEQNRDTNAQKSLPSAQQAPDLGMTTLRTSHSAVPGLKFRDFSGTESQKLKEGGVDPHSFLGNTLANASSQPTPAISPKVVDLDIKSSINLGSSSSSSAWSEPSSKGELLFPVTSHGGSFRNFSPSTAIFSSGKASHSRGQGLSAGSRITEPLPDIHSSQLSSEQNYAFGKTLKNKINPIKENCRPVSLTRSLNSEPHLSKQLGNVEEMIKELETLLDCIERGGGFRDACTVLQETSVRSLEEGIETLSERCKLWESIMDDRLRQTQLLFDDTVQVMAKKFYMQGIVKQASDGQYWELWNQQSLSSELELKRQRMLKTNQELSNQLIELERHMNTLELNKFGENSGVQMSQRTFTSRYGPSRYIQSLHSLLNTMRSQLATAEQLSECLSKQMAVLSIESPVKKHNVKRELFEAIGIPYTSASFRSPDEKNLSRRNQSTALRDFGSDTVRRRRESLDQSWASFEPPRTTVNRILLHEDHEKASTDRSSLLMDKKQVLSQMLEGSIFPYSEHRTTSSAILSPYEKKGIQDRPTKQIENPTVEVSSSKPETTANMVKLESSMPTMPTSEPSASLQSGTKLSFSGMASPASNVEVMSKAQEPFATDVLSSVPSTSESVSGGKSEAHAVVTQEDEMEEEAPETSQTAELTLGSLGDSVIESAPNPTAANPNPFGMTFGNAAPTPASSPFTMTVPTGELFRPASFHFQSLQPSQPSQATSFGVHSGGFSTGTTSQVPAGSAFGQPAQIGGGQQALGSALGAFGQSRQFGFVQPGPSATGLGGGSVSSHSTGGFAGGGFAGLASGGGGFSAAASSFAAAAAATGGGFSGAGAATGGGFSTGTTSQVPAGSVFGQPAQIGGGQQALGSALGAFGQPRQFGFVQPGPSATGLGGGSVSSHSTGGFAGGGFAGLASGGGGFSAAASSFAAAAAATGGGFSGAGAATGGGFSTGTTSQVPAGSVFGQPAQIGGGQQALGSALGAFGQSRQFGFVQPGPSATGLGGGSVSSHSTGGFAGGGFAGLASGGGGFSAAASSFAAAAAATGGGFSGAGAATGGGFAGAASGVGFPGSGGGGGGFGAFSSQQGSGGGGGFSAFGSSAGGSGRPPSPLFTQMRK